MKAKTRLLALSLAFLMVFGTLALSACDKQTGGDKKSYDVTYNLNYDGADKRVYPVQSGTNAPEWKATREGYRIEYWATDSAGKNKYDFSDKVYKELGFFSIWLPFHMDEGLVFMLVFENYLFSSCFLSVRSSIECYVCCCVK